MMQLPLSSDLIDKIEVQWLLFAKDEFPREVRSEGEWITVRSKEEYDEFVMEQFLNEKPAHTSIYPASTPGAYRVFWISHILFEIDPERIFPEGYWSMRGLVEYLEREYSAKPRVYFSGNRSFHIYVDFLPLVVKDPMERLRILARKISLEAKVPYLDFQIYSERHLIRIPYTINEKSKHLAIGIDPSWDMEKIAKYSIAGPEEFPIKRIHYNNSIREALKGLKVERPKAFKVSHPLGKRIGWIDKLLQSGIPDGRKRLIWLVLAPYLMNVLGLSEEEAFSELESFLAKCDRLSPLKPSFSSYLRTARYYLSYAKDSGLKPIKLETIQTKVPELYELIKEVLER